MFLENWTYAIHRKQEKVEVRFVFTHTSWYVKYVIKIFQTKKDEKLRNCLFKLKRIDSNKKGIREGIFASIKGHL